MTEALAAPAVALASDALIALRRIILQADAAPVLANLPGGFATRRKGRGLEVADVRPYVAGDDIRHLDRNATARTGDLHVRQFQEERDRVTLLVADFRPCMFWGLRRAFRSVAAAEALALIGWNIVESGGRVGVLALTTEAPVIVPARGRVRGMLNVVGGLTQAHQAGLMRAATAPGAQEDLPLDEALRFVDTLAPAGSEVIVASGFDTPGPGLSDRLTALARRRTLRLVQIADAGGERLPRGRYPVRLPDGRRLKLTFRNGIVDGALGPIIAGHKALVLDAGDPVEATARRIAAAFPGGRRR